MNDVPKTVRIRRWGRARASSSKRARSAAESVATRPFSEVKPVLPPPETARTTARGGCGPLPTPPVIQLKCGNHFNRRQAE